MILDSIILSMNENKTKSTQELAKELNVDNILIKDGINRLYSLGYIKIAFQEAKCSKCSKCIGENDALNKMKMWEITEKGKNYLKKLEMISQS